MMMQTRVLLPPLLYPPACKGRTLRLPSWRRANEAGKVMLICLLSSTYTRLMWNLHLMRLVLQSRKVPHCSWLLFIPYEPFLKSQAFHEAILHLLTHVISPRGSAQSVSDASCSVLYSKYLHGWVFSSQWEVPSQILPPPSTGGICSLSWLYLFNWSKNALM